MPREMQREVVGRPDWRWALSFASTKGLFDLDASWFSHRLGVLAQDAEYAVAEGGRDTRVRPHLGRARATELNCFLGSLLAVSATFGVRL